MRSRPSTRRPRRLASTSAAWLVAVGCFLGASSASAPARALEEGREGTPRAAADDQLAGQLLVRAAVEVVGPVGSVVTDVAADDVAASGIGFGASIGLGLTRQAELQLVGGFAELGDPARCSPCGGDTARVGLGLAYHLAQGVAVDPWARWGMGFRTTAIDDTGASNRVARELEAGRYHGVDLTQLAVGAIWSPTGGFGVGPYVEMDLGTFVSRPDGAGSSAVYAYFTAGFAVQLAPGRFGISSVDPAPATASGAARPGEGRPGQAPRLGRPMAAGGPPSF